jgi:hypothetical protein
LCNIVGAAGLEPTTSCTPCKRATRLRHAPEQLSEASISNGLAYRKIEIWRQSLSIYCYKPGWRVATRLRKSYTQ